MKTIFTALILIVVIFTPAIAADTNAIPYDFITGKYQVVGQEPVSGKVYKGVVAIKLKADGVSVSRNINGKTTTANGKFMPPNPEAHQMLEVDFNNSRAIYYIFSDNDNYALMPGRIYSTDGSKEGMETLYPIK